MPHREADRGPLQHTARPTPQTHRSTGHSSPRNTSGKSVLATYRTQSAAPRSAPAPPDATLDVATCLRPVEAGAVRPQILGLALCVVCANAQVRSAACLLASLYLTHALCVQTRRWSVRLFRVPTAAPLLLHVAFVVRVLCVVAGGPKVGLRGTSPHRRPLCELTIPSTLYLHGLRGAAETVLCYAHQIMYSTTGLFVSYVSRESRCSLTRCSRSIDMLRRHEVASSS